MCREGERRHQGDFPARVRETGKLHSLDPGVKPALLEQPCVKMDVGQTAMLALTVYSNQGQRMVEARGREGAQWMQAPATKSDDLSLVPGPAA